MTLPAAVIGTPLEAICAALTPEDIRNALV
jgi:hypothetical protein